MLPQFLIELDPKIFLSDEYLTLDFENAHYGTGFPSAHNVSASMTLSCWADANGEHYSWGNEYELQDLLEDTTKVRFLVAANAKHELGWLKRCGADIHKILVWDTMLAEKVIAGNRVYPKGHYTLNETLKRHGLGGKENTVSKMIHMGICPSIIPKSMLLRYCRLDVLRTEQLFLRQREVLKERGLLKVMFTRCLMVPVLADVEFNGMHLDPEMVHIQHIEAVKGLYEAQTELDTYAKGINWRSPKQTTEYLYDTLRFNEAKDSSGKVIKTTKGGRSKSSEAILALIPKTAKQKKFVELYQKWNKADTRCTKYLVKFQKCCDENDGHLLGKFSQCRAKTHRLTSQGGEFKVQFQNFDRTFKPLFRASKPGNKIVESDYSGLEFRGAGFLCKDQAIYKAIKNKEDIHADTAEQIFGSKFIDAKGKERKALRTAAKSRTFLPLFGGCKGSDKERRYFAFFKKKYHQVTSTQDQWIEEARVTKKLTAITGLITYWPYVKITHTGYINDNEKVRNWFIQNFSTAEIAQIGAVYTWHRLKTQGLDSLLVNLIHDSCILDAPEDELETIEKLLQQAMVEDVLHYLQKVYGINYDIKLDIEIESGYHWGS